MKIGFAGIVIAAVGGIVACGSAGQGNTEEASATAQGRPVLLGDDVGAVQQTIVVFQPDGTKKVTQKVLTFAEQKIEEEARAKHLATPAEERVPYALTEESCADAGIVLFNYTNEQGASGVNCPATICFYNGGSSPDYANLADYTFKLNPYSTSMHKFLCELNTTPWDGEVASFWPWEQNGCLSTEAQQGYTSSSDFQNIPSYATAPTDVTSTLITDYLWLSASTTEGDESGYCDVVR